MDELDALLGDLGKGTLTTTLPVLVMMEMTTMTKWER